MEVDMNILYTYFLRIYYRIRFVINGLNMLRLYCTIIR